MRPTKVHPLSFELLPLVLLCPSQGGMDGAWFLGPMYVDDMAFAAAGLPTEEL